MLVRAGEDFDRVLKADSTSEKGRVNEFLTSCWLFEGLSVVAVHALAACASRKTFIRDQPCLVYPPHAALGAASFSPDYIYMYAVAPGLKRGVQCDGGSISCVSNALCTRLRSHQRWRACGARAHEAA